MNSRRAFIKKIGSGAVMSSLAMPPAIAGISDMNKQQEKPKDRRGKKIKIGIIGAENSHTIGFGKLFNIEKKFPGAEVVAVWGETEAFARNAMEKGGIPKMVKDPLDMLEEINALIVDHRHPKYHLEAARPFIKVGVPTFIDKPFCYRVAEGRAFLSMAREVGTPVTSYSSIAYSEATFDIKKQVEEMGEYGQIVRTGPVDLDSKYGGVFFYGVHIVQPLMFIFGEDIDKVKITRNGSRGSAGVLFQNGHFATLVFKKMAYGWETFVDTKDGFVELKSRVDEADPAKNYVDMVNMFRTGKEPRSHDSILKCVAVLEALEKSAESEDWEQVNF